MVDEVKVEAVEEEVKVEELDGRSGLCKVGDKVTSIWGQGVVETIREDGTVCFTLENWELAYGSKVRMFLNPKNVGVVSCVGDWGGGKEGRTNEE